MALQETKSARIKMYTVPAAGLSEPLYFSPSIHSCGEIKDGIALCIGRRGSFVVDIADLREMLRLAEERRIELAARRA